MVAKAKKKKIKIQSGSPLRIRKGQLQDPSWTGYETWTGEAFHIARRRASEYYYKNYKPSDLQEYAYTWMLDNDYTKEDVKCAKADKRFNINQSVGYLCRMLSMGMPDFFLPHEEFWASCKGTSNTIKPITEYIIPKISAAIESGKPIVDQAKLVTAAIEKETTVARPTIRQLMFEASIVMAENIDEFIDEFIADCNPKNLTEFDPLNILRAAMCKQNHARIIRKFYEDALTEMEELNTKVAKDDKDDLREQLEEGYAHLKPSQRKAWLDLYRKICDACDIIIAESKATRSPRKAKVRSITDIVKKLKFKSSDSTYGVASVQPTDIVGANILVVFNTKNRKLGVYYASNIDPTGLMRQGSGLNVKGTTIIGFDEAKSIQKTIRKPSEFLPQIKKTTRSKTEKLFEGMKTTETKLNGRINAETILLATFTK